jgi:hypothetical protein
VKEIVWKINPATNTHDIDNYFTQDGNTGNLEVIKSKILIRLSTFQGEWAPDPEFGISIDAISDQAENPDVIAQILTNEILQVENVNNVQIDTLEYLATTRSFSATIKANTIFGTITITV